MGKIWYVLKCPKGNEADYVKGYQETIKPDNADSLQQVIHFQYQRMIRYKGQWHMEERAVLPGYVFLSGAEKAILKRQAWEGKENEELIVTPCEIPYLKCLCTEGSLVEMSKGSIKSGVLEITSGPLRGREQLIKKIDRHKRTAEIEIPLEGRNRRVIVGLEIYAKQI